MFIVFVVIIIIIIIIIIRMLNIKDQIVSVIKE